MQRSDKLLYSAQIADRIRLIMEILGLELSGFSEFTQISESHLYAILNGKRKLTRNIAEKIGEKLDFDGWKIQQLDHKIPMSIRRATELSRFYIENKDVLEFFVNTKDERKASHFIEFGLIKAKVFDEPKYIWEIRQICSEAKRNYKSKDLSQLLLYLTEKGKLKKEKRPLKRRDGTFTENRLVYVFFKPDFKA
ncbi:hypothetical protein DSL64_03760 [Dyadobacter luteus]|uniref:HTH cro/C1-type domain-containing protein n=1 Tax=Dyadobacter luteus TaxID=2259619 RepID=A0A3D8YGP4_9BACT|nr:helix-turn-helix transcriptional regulator [Dyadobacter luteus]REA63569.1 hypothetical protein DSL64_03760 [Dyadobacter luteus]